MHFGQLVVIWNVVQWWDNYDFLFCSKTSSVRADKPTSVRRRLGHTYSICSLATKFMCVKHVPVKIETLVEALT